MASFFGKLLLLMIFGPMILAILAPWAVAVFILFLPWMLVAAAIAGAAAGFTAGVVIRRMLTALPDPRRQISREQP